MTGISSAAANVAVIEGIASVYGERDRNGDIVRSGAFKNTLGKIFSKKLIPARPSAVKMLHQHAADQPIGRWTGFRDTARGLWVRGEILLDSPRAREVASLIAGGALDGLSIGFRTRRARKIAGGRELTEIDLWEISVVTFPMAPGARITRIDMPGTDNTAGLLRQAAQRLAS